MANLKYKDNHGNWVSLSTVRGPMGPEGPQGPVGPEARINLNGSQVQNPSFYAPLTGGTAGQILTSNGNGAAPTWEEATTNLEVVNNLNTSTASDTKVLGAYEGYVLNQNKVDKSLTIAGLTLQNNISLTQLHDAGVARNSDLNNYLPLTGGTINGSLATTSGFGKKYSFTKTIAIGTDWTDCGIANTNLESGTYAVQITGVYSGSSTWQQGVIWSGIMSWYEGETNSSDAAEITLHGVGHARNGCTLYLRTLGRTRSSGDTKLQIKYTNATNSIPVDFKFIKLI